MTLTLIPFLGALWGMSEVYLALRKRSRSDATSRDRNSLRIMWLVDFVSIGLAFLAAYRLPSWRLPWLEQVYVLGLCLFASGLLLRWYSIIYLGRFFTTNVAIAADHQLIDSGPYRLIRHPSYTGAMLTFLGFGLGFGNLASLLVITVPIFATLLWRIRIEEEALVEAFGARYRSYVQRTKRLIPLVY
jgi:protein-S-isoprenylcysteine O-methyltransferase